MKENWRDSAAAEVVIGFLAGFPPQEPALVLNDPLARVVEAIREEGASVDWWSRRILPGAMVAPFFPPGPYRTVLLRLPRSRDELEMMLHTTGGILAPGGTLLVYGANDEGVASSANRIEPLFGPVETVVVKRRCRVLRAVCPPSAAGFRSELVDWREVVTLEIEGQKRRWASYPGVFAHGRVDPGTALLLRSLPTIKPGARVLDFGCGSGVIGAGILIHQPEAVVQMLDNDILALVAAWDNVPGVKLILGSELSAAPPEPYDLIVSNPPFHEGKAEALGVLGHLISQAPSHLSKKGSLVIVVQKRLPVKMALEASFSRVEIVTDDRTYRVWRASGR